MPPTLPSRLSLTIPRQWQLTHHGQKCEQFIKITGSNGRVIEVQFLWIKNTDGVCRLVTAIPNTLLRADMFREYDVVELVESLSDSLKIGTRGAVVMVYPGERPEYEVEFVDVNGRTIDVRAVSPDKLRLATS